MCKLKISVITVTYNAADTLRNCLQAVISQTYNHIEYIVIDGASTDETLNIISAYKGHISALVSEKDKGIYDALNKGIALATGDIIGILNADDVFAENDVLSDIAHAFNKNEVDIVYGDLEYVNKNKRVIRRWRSGRYAEGKFNYGWMPPHPTFYCKRELFEKFGNYSLEFGTAADYELMLRFIHLNKATVFYLRKVLVKMLTGGVSNKSYKNRMVALFFDMKAMYRNGIYFPPIALLAKPLRKIVQFITDPKYP